MVFFFRFNSLFLDNFNRRAFKGPVRLFFPLPLSSRFLLSPGRPVSDRRDQFNGQFDKNNRNLLNMPNNKPPVQNICMSSAQSWRMGKAVSECAVGRWDGLFQPTERNGRDRGRKIWGEEDGDLRGAREPAPARRVLMDCGGWGGVRPGHRRYS